MFRIRSFSRPFSVVLCTAMALALAAASQSIRVVDKSTGPTGLHGPDPNYPAQAFNLGIEGDVVLRIHIARDGRVDQVTPVSGHALLIPASVEAIKQWQFVPREGWTDWSFKFSLKWPYYESGSLVTHRVEPLYPVSAKLKDIHGTVRLVALFNESGRVQHIWVISGNEPLVSAAKEAVQQWEFLRTRRDGRRIGGTAVVELPFAAK
jgi:TonB family protein